MRLIRRPAGVEKTLAGCLIFVYNRFQKGGRYAQYIFRGYGPFTFGRRPAYEKIAQEKDLTINLRHIMDFGEKSFEARILNTDTIVHNMSEFIYIAGDYV